MADSSASLIAVNAYTGQLVRRHWTGPQPQRSGSRPNGTPRYASSGVSVWSTPVLDEESQTLLHRGLRHPRRRGLLRRRHQRQVYEGSGDGKLRVFSAATGQVLWQYDVIRDLTTVIGVPARGKALSGGGGAVVVDGMPYVQADYYPDTRVTWAAH
jgi:outer membrane protein assembly factor BamB